jgi:hypothetical protein
MQHLFNQMIIERTVLLSISALGMCSVLDSDPNANLFTRLLPVFENEEEHSVVQGKTPLLGGETGYSLQEATERVQKLLDEGVIDEPNGTKLMNSLRYAERVRHVASLMDGGKLVSEL